MRKARIGKSGEELAARFARLCGLVVLSRNDRRFGGEIDLLCRDRNGSLVILEVKLRHRHIGYPVISASQRARLSAAAAALEQTKGEFCCFSFFVLVADPQKQAIEPIPFAVF
ncbi:MAG: YraN family protein [Leptospiraceae bacterium]|nr:YraN family protein [Leptospiraceae bacterium]